VSRHSEPQSGWALVAGGLALVVGAGIGLGVAGRILSPSIWLDIVALWPVAAVGLIATPIVWLAAGRQPRHLAIAGLSLFTWLVLGFGLHLSGGEGLPVAEAVINGPDAASLDAGRLLIDLDGGTVVLDAADVSSYRVSPLRAGGTIGVASVLEQVRGSVLTVAAVPREDAGLYRFRGWLVELGDALRWSVEMAAGTLDVDLDGTPVSFVRLAAVERSRVHIGTTDEPAELVLEGDFIVVADAEAAVSVTGEASVPSAWSTRPGGADAPVAGTGWSIVVEEGATVEIRLG